MDQTVLKLLQNIDRRLENIEEQVFKQNDKISALEKCMKVLNAQNKSEDVRTDHSEEPQQCNNDNFINHMKAELENVEKKTSDPRTQSSVRKAASFQDKSVRKPVRKRRTPHTVPSDKDEERRLRSFRRECLSKAIQWNFVDLVHASAEKEDIVLPKWLKKEDAEFIREGRDRKDKMRRFLIVLKKKEFGVMQEWLTQCGLDAAVVKQVWVTYDEFSDINANRSRMKCFRCRLIENVNVVDIADYLYSADILSSEQLLLKISSSARPPGAQEELWNLVLQECSNFECKDIVSIAVKVALTDKKDLVDDKTSHIYESLLSDIPDTAAQDLLLCTCSERCTKSFHPVSCLKTMSMAGVYFSPPTERKRESKSSSSEDPQSSQSSSSSTETVFDSQSEIRKGTSEETLCQDEETLVKTPVVGSERPRQGDSQEKSLLKPSGVPSMSFQRKRSRKTAITYQSDSSMDGEKNTMHVKNHNKVLNNFSHNLENKPNVICAQTVYLDTGPKYYSVNRKVTSSESSSEV